MQKNLKNMNSAKLPQTLRIKIHNHILYIIKIETFKKRNPF